MKNSLIAVSLFVLMIGFTFYHHFITNPDSRMPNSAVEEMVVAKLKDKGFSDIHIVRSYPSTVITKRARMDGQGFDITATRANQEILTYAFYRPVNHSVALFDSPPDKLGK